MHRGAFSAVEMKGLQDVISRIDIRGAIAKGLIGDRSNVFEALTGDSDRNNDFESMQGFPKALARFHGILLNLRIYRLYDVAQLARDFETLHAVATLAPHERTDRLEALDAELLARPSFGNLFPKLLLPAFARSYRAEDRVMAALGTAEVALALARFESSESALPSTLDALVPGYLARMPIDPFNGEPLRFRVSPNGFVIYSVGPDLEDDAGRPPVKPHSINDDGDVTFEFLRPEK